MDPFLDPLQLFGGGLADRAHAVLYGRRDLLAELAKPVLGLDPPVAPRLAQGLGRLPELPAGLLSEDTDFETGELWGNYPQTYSLVGLINCAGLLSRPWSAVR